VDLSDRPGEGSEAKGHLSGEAIMLRSDQVTQERPTNVSPPVVVTLTRGGSKERVAALITTLRPKQWIKNLTVFIGIAFAFRLFSTLSVERVVLACVTFCLASSTIYLINDLFDRESDRQHPVKCTRPLASGRLPVAWALVAIGMLLLLCSGLIMLLYFVIPPQHDFFALAGGANSLFALIVVSYVLLMILYSVYLKYIVLVDVFVIALGFVLRLLAGTVVLPVSISPWLYMVTWFLSLFLALCKRRQELALLQEQSFHSRPILKEYTLPLLDRLIAMAVAATIVAYCLYIVQGLRGNYYLILTVPLVLYGMFRYLYLVYMHSEGGSPEEILFRDRQVLGVVVGCSILTLVALYL
jgi:4-hydroxybenzoate polyprenyltransferase